MELASLNVPRFHLPCAGLATILKMVRLGLFFRNFMKYRGWYFPPEPEGVLKGPKGEPIKRKGFFYPKGSIEGFDPEKKIPMRKKGFYYPPEAHDGLYAGKGILFGHYKTWSGKRVDRIWQPNVQWATLYSKILQEEFKLRVTTHALRWIDKAGGFDRYILDTPARKLQSRKGMELKLYMRNVVKGLQEGKELKELKEQFGPKPPVNKHIFVPPVYTNRFYNDFKGPRKQMVFC